MTIHTTNLQEHLPASLQNECDNVQEIATFYEDFIETLIDDDDSSFECYLEMEGRDDLLILLGKIEFAGIYVKCSTNVFFTKYVDSVDEKTLKSTTFRVVLT